MTSPSLRISPPSSPLVRKVLAPLLRADHSSCLYLVSEYYSHSWSTPFSSAFAFAFSFSLFFRCSHHSFLPYQCHHRPRFLLIFFGDSATCSMISRNRSLNITRRWTLSLDLTLTLALALAIRRMCMSFKLSPLKRGWSRIISTPIQGKRE